MAATLVFIRARMAQLLCLDLYLFYCFAGLPVPFHSPFWHKGKIVCSTPVKHGLTPGGCCRDCHLGTLLFSLSHCNSYEDRVPVDEIYGCPIFRWVAVTWLKCVGHRDISTCNGHQGGITHFLSLVTEMAWLSPAKLIELVCSWL